MTPAELGRLAKASLSLHGDKGDEWYGPADLQYDDQQVVYPEDAAFIAACTPEVVLGLCARIEELEAKVSGPRHDA